MGFPVSLCPPFLVLPALGHYPSFLSAILLWGTSLLLWRCLLTGLPLLCWFLGHTLPPADVLDDPASTYFPLGMSLVMTGIFQSSFQSFISHSTSSALMQNQSCSHSFSRSLRAWIHMLCHVALKLAIPWYWVTTSSYPPCVGYVVLYVTEIPSKSVGITTSLAWNQSASQ
jgi:hypothetical protein